MKLFDTKKHLQPAQGTSKENIINAFQNAGKVLRTVTGSLVIALLAQQIYPTILAAQTGEFTKLVEKQRIYDDRKLDNVFAKMSNRFSRYKKFKDEGKDAEKEMSEMEELRGSFEEADAKMMAEFKEQEAFIKSKNLDPIIMERHKKMVQHYKSQRNKLRDEVDVSIKEHGKGFFSRMAGKIKSAFSDEKTQELIKSPFKNINTEKFNRYQQPFDVNNLPNRRLQADPNNKPKIFKEQFSSLQPIATVAALGDFDYSKLKEADNPLYLEESDEIMLSDKIKAKAEELEYDPVKISNWVRNNIEWLPTWGAIQNAELTLSARRGNAMDIASLTISLLRASKIPARYVHGTINVPAEKFKNWAGGFETIQAAAGYAADGGIPLGAIIIGGKIDSIQMEHVWVEAASDYYPSRGANNFVADAWVEMDTSFKQYAFKKSKDLDKITGLDLETTVNTFANSGSVNQSENWVSGINQKILQDAIEEYRSSYSNYIDGNFTNPTSSDVIGGRQSIIKYQPVLPSSLPNEIVVTGTRYDKLPSSLQQRITIGYADPVYGAINGSNQVTFPFSKLNNEKVTFSFRPSTQADQDILAALIPENNTTNPSSTLPANLISVTPELKVNESVVSSGEVVSLGTEIDVYSIVSLVGRGSQPKQIHRTPAGAYLSINVISGSVSPDKLQELQKKIEDAQEAMSSDDLSQWNILTRERILGDLLFAGSLNYFSQLSAFSRGLGLNSDVHYNLLSGEGVFGYEPNVSYLFGAANKIEYGGIHLDIPILAVVANTNGDVEKEKQFFYNMGTQASALEHSIPESMFTTDNKLDGISTIKAFQLAVQNNQKIYTITKENMETALPNIHHDSSVMSEIKASLNKGFEVITHTNSVSVAGWQGAGYIILDPVYGTGAYKISGGNNGGFLDFLIGLKSFLWIAVASGLGAVDAVTGSAAGGNFWFSQRLQYLAKMAGISKFLGITALLVSSVQIASDDTLSNGQKTLQIGLNVAAFFATNALLRAAFIFAPWLALVMGAIIAGVIATIAFVLASEYLSFRSIRLLYRKELRLLNQIA